MLQTCKAQTSQKSNCPLNCNKGTCKLVDGQTPKCICPAKYSGTYCEHYRCSQFCQNKGMCYVDLLQTSESDGLAPLRCNCPPNWTGERCEIPIKVCDGGCYNGGTCSTTDAGTSICECRPGFTGTRCEHCEKLTCQNGGVCAKTDEKDVCKCLDGYSGTACELEPCQINCGPHGTCVKSSNGMRCKCEPGFSGPNCDRDACHKHCLNGGTCNIGAKQPECVCPPLFNGRRCEYNLCSSPQPPPECKQCKCKNNGVCVKIRTDLYVCNCASSWGGETCEVSISCWSKCLLLFIYIFEHSK